jgi:putative LysE/RhtB family amino acid efflux pump
MAVVEGLLVGIAVAAPVGPISLLCIRHTLEGGFVRGLAAGCGVATVHAGLACAIGTGLVGAAPPDAAAAFALVGSTLLAFLGWRTLHCRVAVPQAVTAETRFASAYGSALLLALANPMTLLPYLGFSSALGIAGTGRLSDVAGFAGGAFAGAGLWYAALSRGVSWGRDRVSGRTLHHMNRACGLMMLLLAIWLAGSTWTRMLRS